MSKNWFFWLLTSLLLTSSSSAEAQQPKKVPRIGFLVAGSPSATSGRIEAFRQGLRELGYVEGKNIVIEYHYAEGKLDRIPDLAAELVRLKVDIIFSTGPQSTRAAQETTSTIPIVMGFDNDPVSNGFVASLAQPGGNITGTTNIMPELAGKRLEILREVLPNLSRIAFLAYGPDPAHRLFVKDAEDAARSLKIQFHPSVVETVDEIDGAFQSMAKERVGALIVQPLFPSSLAQGPRIAALAVKNRIPTISDGFQFAELGGLMFYGPDPIAPYQRAATFVDKILKGRKPADLPVEQPTKFLFIINLQTAKQIGLTIPQSVLYRADKVIK